MSVAVLSIEVPDLAHIDAASDLELIGLMQAWAAARRQVDAGIARLAAAVKTRSSLELGYSGLAQRSGDRTPDAMVARVTGTSGPEARTLVAVGGLLEAPEPWLAPVADAVRDGRLSVGAAGAITTGLGVPNAGVAADDLADAALALVESGLPPEKIARRARELRDELDDAGVADREALLRSKRYLRLTPLADGMTRIHGLLDPESAALVTSAVDLVTAPRRGGPRFVSEIDTTRAQRILNDSRTTEQLALDALVQMIRIAAAADSGTVFGTHRPAVTVHVTATDLDRRQGIATIEGQTAGVSVTTAERLACSGGYLPIRFRHSGTLDLGRTRRSFTAAQRAVLAATWGGCALPDCDRPPSWTEAHHIDPWSHGGRTDIADGILLCRHHHMLVHNNHWRIHRDGTGYHLTPPPDDPLTPPIRLEPQNPTHQRLMRLMRSTD
ncbi:MAG TPA: DUF222 domain-containing protein [Pseudolysinimonas sp.]|nr:DUF222 domain-containing protein [Pseudolysinimonas sp.]